MVHTQVSAEIERPVTTVFEFVAVEFFDNYPRWSPEVRELEPLDGNAVQAGIRARQVRVDRGRRSETVFRVTDLEPYRRVRFEGTPPPSSTGLNRSRPRAAGWSSRSSFDGWRCTCGRSSA